MNEREKPILKILRRTPFIQQPDKPLDLSRSRIAAHLME